MGLPASILVSENPITDLETYSQRIALDFLNNFKNLRFWIMKSEVFIKQSNLLEDPAVWEGWRLDLDLESEEPLLTEMMVRKVVTVHGNRRNENGDTTQSINRNSGNPEFR